MTNPILVNVTRDPEAGKFTESWHRGSFSIVDANGKEICSVGDVEARFCPRSALKPLQALCLLESGAADHFDLNDTEIALAAASHNGEARHVQAVVEWLKKIDCSIDQLECGPQVPLDRESAQALAQSGAEPSALHNNCSGKHAAFMTIARHMGVDVVGYTQPDHPVQERVSAIISEMIGGDVAPFLVGPDGCQAPNFAVPLRAFSHGLARMGRTESLSPARGSAARTLIRAVEADPYLIAGKGRVCSILTSHLTGGGMVKSGAEGCFGAILPGPNLGIAIKIDDGGKRAAELVIATLIDRLGLLDAEMPEREKLLHPSITNTRDEVVGNVVLSDSWDDINIPTFAG